MSIFDLSDRIVVITGGYGYLGAGITKGLLEFNCKVIVAGRSYEKFVHAFQGVNSSRLFFKEIDVLEKKSIDNCIKEVVSEFGRIDVLINNAHSVKGDDIEEINEDDLFYTFEAVMGSVYKCISSVIPVMKNQRYGKIVNVSSMYGLVSPDPDLYKDESFRKYFNPPHYGAGKAGILQLTRYFANYLGAYNVFVNAVSPGPFPNKEVQNKDPEFVKKLESKTSLKKIGRPRDLVGVFVLLSSDASEFITGQNFVVDGGWISK
ncbi:MAG: SDR family oxidoreductase [Flavobacteriales bacterium]